MEIKDSEFSLFNGGVLNRLFVFLRLEKPNTPRFGRRILVLTGIAFAPLAGLCLAQGTAWGDHVRVPLFHDPGVLTRFLFSLPLLILAEGGVNREICAVVSYLKTCGIFREQENPLFEQTVERGNRLANSVLAEVLILAAVVLAVWFRLDIDPVFGPGITHWQSDVATQSVGAAGTWFRLVSCSIFRFIIIRWAWRYLIWSWFLWKVSGFHLNLMSTHPDGKGGLGILADSQASFSLVAAAGTAQISGFLGRSMVFDGTSLASHQVLIGGSIAIIVSVFLLPLCVFNRQLFACRKQGLRTYGALAERYTGLFDQKWLSNKTANPDLLGTPDIQSLADLGSGYDVVRRMGLFPLDARLVAVFLVSTAAPFVPLAFFAHGADQVLLRIMKLLI